MSKILNLLNEAPLRAVLTTRWLTDAGYNPQLLYKYVHSGWLEKVGDGAYKKSQVKLTWDGAVWALQQYGSFIVSGKTALSLQGHEHFLSFGRQTVYIKYNASLNVPKWVKNYDFQSDLVFLRSHDVNLAYINNHTLNDLTLKISCAELAALELCSELVKYHSYESAFRIFEGLTTLRTNIIQMLLEGEGTIKAKRLFLHFAKEVGHAWFNDIDLSRINLGVGKRKIVENGKLDKDFLITVPQNFE